MRYSIPIKFIAVMLTALSLVIAFTCALGIMQVAELGLYADGLEGWIQNRLEWKAYDLAEDLTDRYAVRKLTNCTEDVLEELGYWYLFEESVHWTGLSEESYSFSIVDPEGKILAQENGLPDHIDGFSFQTGCSIHYPVMITSQSVIDQTYGTEYLYRKTVYPAAYDGKAVTVRYYESPEYTVSVTINPDAAMDRTGTSLELVKLIYEQRYNLMIILAASLIVLAAGIVYIAWAAGTAPGGKTGPTGLNRLPLDIYVAVGTLAGYFLSSFAAQMINYWIFSMDNLNAGTLVLVGLVLLGVALILVGFVFALCAQVKEKNLYVFRHMVLVWIGGKLWLGMRFVAGGLRKLFDLMPVVWHYLLIGGLAGVLVALGVLLAFYGYGISLIVVAICYLLIVCYAGYAYGVILHGAERMAKGDLNCKINSRILVGNYARCAQALNALADVALVAAQKQIQSERMRTELITNVSHDIKTPLTSIINYVDLMKTTQDLQTNQQYLEVLGRQSQRLKKLIEDLMEMSRASSGNIPVNPAVLDPVEAINQALGEFSEKMEAKELTVVFRQPVQPISILADGRLVWRVLSNLLSNVVKYALPGTRVYLDAMELEDKVLISLKNISREALNVPANELTERFVQGDLSRSTEGSGLGLNIAKSLMELQKGQLELLVDGDLFKATLIFPKA